MTQKAEKKKESGKDEGREERRDRWGRERENERRCQLIQEEPFSQHPKDMPARTI